MDPNPPNPPNSPPPSGQASVPEEVSLESDASTSTGSLSVDTTGNLDAPAAPATSEPSGLKKFLRRFNIYLLLFVLLIVAAAAVVLIAWLANRGSSKPQVQTQSLTDATLKQLANSDVSVGQPKQVLNVQSNAVFAGKVLVRDGLEVAGPLQIGGALSLPSITVDGNSVFGSAQVGQNLNVSGSSAFAGTVNMQKSLSVAGNGSFGGSLTAPQLAVNSLQLNGDLNLTHHITAGGATPGRSAGSALGGGVASVSGSDTAGSINISTGSAPNAGCLVTINFAQRFNTTPHVLLTPIGSGAAGLSYYVNRSSSSFSVCTTNPPPGSATFGFDYFVLD